MSNKYLTVAEFASNANITRQAVYDQIRQGKRLYPYVKKINGKKRIKADALAYYTTPGGAPEPEPEPEAKDPIISLLTEQLAVKDKQLETLSASLAAKDAQIKDLSETIRANMTMLYALQSQVARLTGEVAPEEQTQEPATRSAAPEKPAEPVARAADPEPEANDPEPGKRAGGFWAWLLGRVRD